MVVGDRGASHIVHISVAEAGFDNMHVEQVQLPLVALGSLIAAADQSKATTGEEATMFVDELASGFWLRVNVGKEASALESTCLRAIFSAGVSANVEIAAIVNMKVGRTVVWRARAVAFGSWVTAMFGCLLDSPSDFTSVANDGVASGVIGAAGVAASG